MRQAGRMWSNGAVHNEARVNCVQNFRFHITIFTYCGVGLKQGRTKVTECDIQARAHLQFFTFNKF